MNNKINIITQAFYGNKTNTDIDVKKLDRFILGYLDDDIKIEKEIDRTIVNIPNTKNIVIIYNKYQEEIKFKQKEEVLKNEGYEIKPLAIIPEIGLELYSRCIVCRMNKDGELESLKKGDYKKFMKYLAD